ncbi:type IV pilin protein [Paracidovorax anthurii]|uniref:Type IV pilus assembly protein PilE n=1 Tax=Paracidovorax anthurii TaxID=78229 RepID=A0A328YSR1_9BURK|nr:type IV pilin protein [Paracidovorax anthurii]RAR76163.1 type IV pilus assembly protein PilE [Paracidovorax anthurii]
MSEMKQKGFTLIELMIVVAIIGVLAAVAYPSYMESMRKSKRTEGRNALIVFLQQQERYMTQNNTYLALNAGAEDAPFRTHSGSSGSSKEASYLIGARACGGQAIKDCVQVFATPQYNEPALREINITSLGVRGCSGVNNSVCWQ